MRTVPLANGGIYHVYNRGVDKRNIMLRQSDLQRYLVGMYEFNSIDLVGSLRNLERSKDVGNVFVPKKGSERLVDILCYCLNKNHYHFILKQLVDDGISKFMHRWGTSCTKYFNTKYHRTGVLFQGKFKAAHIIDNERLLELSVYVNLNNRLHTQAEGKSKSGRSSASANFGSLSKSSFDFYVGERRQSDLVSATDLILGQFSKKEKYGDFAEDCFSNLLERKEQDKELEQLMIEEWS